MTIRSWLAPLRVVPPLLLLALWALDVLFIAIHYAHSATARRLLPFMHETFPAESWGLEVDRGYPEIYGYVKQLIAVLVLLWLAQLTRHWLFAAWGALYTVVLLDDSIALHESFGQWIAETVNLPAEVGPVRGGDVGELVAWGLLGLVPLVVVVVLHRRSGSGTRTAGRTLALLFGALIFCAVVLDGVHSAFLGDGAADGMLAVAEDGGELLVLSLILAFVVGLLRRVRITSAAPSAPDSRMEAGQRR